MTWSGVLLMAGALAACWPAEQASEQSAGWSPSILSVTADGPQFVSGDGWPGRPAGHRWIALTTQLASPEKGARLPASEVRLVAGAASYPATAVAHQVNLKDSLIYLPLLVLPEPHPDTGVTIGKDRPRGRSGWSSLRQLVNGRLEAVSTSFFQDMDIKKELFRVELTGATSREIVLVRSPLTLVFLFAVPNDAANLQLRVADAPPIWIPAAAGGGL